MKKVLYIIIGAVAFLFLLGSGCRGLARTMYNSMDCNRFNIDHIELRTGINITDTDSLLYCELSDYQRRTAYVLNPKAVDFSNYAPKYFRYVDSSYIATGADEHTIWSATLDTNTRIITFDLQYQP